MKVVHVVRQFPPSVGGLEEAVVKLCLALRSRGVETAVVTLDRIATNPGHVLPQEDTIAGIPVRRIAFRGSWRYPLAPSVLAHLRDADVVHVHGIDFFFDYLAVTQRLHRKPLVASTHGGFFHTRFAQTLKKVYFRTVTRASCRAYRAICASSESDFALFHAIAPQNLHVVENGVDVAKWRDRASPVPRRSLLSIGRFSSNKQLPALIGVLRNLRRHHPDWTLTIAGRPYDVTTSALERHAEANGVADAVRLLDNPSDADIAAVLGSASYIASASRYEGFGISAVEGMSAGLMPVLNCIPPFETLIAKADLGRLVDFADAEQAAAAIEDLHRSALHKGTTWRRRAMEAAAVYSWDTSARLVAQLYADALDVPRTVPVSGPVGVDR